MSYRLCGLLSSLLNPYLNPMLDIASFLRFEDGLPIPEWDWIQSWIDAHCDMDSEPAAWTDACRQWLNAFQEKMGPAFRVRESARFLAVLPDTPSFDSDFLVFADHCHAKIPAVLPGVARYEAKGKEVILGFRNSAEYYRYIAAYYPDGSFGDSMGVHIREGRPHIALWGADQGSTASVVAHELTHAALKHLDMPQWIEEGLARVFEHDLSGYGLLQLTAEMANEHKRYWRKNGLDDFWRGEGFSRPGKVQELSYQLAEILMRLMLEDSRPGWFGRGKEKRQRFLAFLQDASVTDCGAEACRERLGCELSDLAGRFLGAGDWEPGL